MQIFESFYEGQLKQQICYSKRSSLELAKHMVKLVDKKIITIVSSKLFRDFGAEYRPLPNSKISNFHSHLYANFRKFL